MKDYYAVLRVSRTVSVLELKRVYRKLALKLHPDVTSNDESKAQQFKAVTEAYNVLSDPDLRAQYDRESFVGSGTPHTRQTDFATTADQEHPYAHSPPGTGINEEVWVAHHYGGSAYRYSSDGGVPPRSYGAHVYYQMELEKIEEEKRRKKITASASYFLRRDARIKQEEHEARINQKNESAKKPDDDCVIC